MSRLFDGSSDQAAAYAKYRPQYPADLFERIYQYAGEPQPKDTALDVATGSGQAAREIAQRYHYVIAQDVSEAQLAAAPELGDRVRFMRASAEDTQLPDGSVSLVTVATALHWFDLAKFYSEAHRVLRPGGTLAAWSYNVCRILGAPEADAALQRLYNGVLGPYWDNRSVLADNHYRDVHLDPRLFEDVQRWSMDMRITMTVGALLGLVQSSSGYAAYRRENPQMPDPLVQLDRDLKDALEFQTNDDEIDIVHPVFMILGRRKIAT